MVRTDEEESCTERLIRAQVPRVYIGILDPNQGVCGKGVVELQRSKTEIALFPHKLAVRITRLSEAFTRYGSTSHPSLEQIQAVS